LKHIRRQVGHINIKTYKTIKNIPDNPYAHPCIIILYNVLLPITVSDTFLNMITTFKTQSQTQHNVEFYFSQYTGIFLFECNN